MPLDERDKAHIAKAVGQVLTEHVRRSLASRDVRIAALEARLVAVEKRNNARSIDGLMIRK